MRHGLATVTDLGESTRLRFRLPSRDTLALQGIQIAQVGHPTFGVVSSAILDIEEYPWGSHVHFAQL